MDPRYVTVQINVCILEFLLRQFCCLIFVPSQNLTLRSLPDRNWNSRGVWEKYQKLIVGGLEKLKILIAGRGLAFKFLFLLLCNHENYSIRNIWVFSKSKMNTQVTNKENLENDKSNMLLSSFWEIFIRAHVFSTSSRANFSSFEYLCFSFLLIF